MENNLHRKVGVWLDHAQAHFVDLSKGPAIVETAFSDQESQLRNKGESGTGNKLGNYRSTNNENHRHNREKELKHEYFKMLSDRLKNFDDILLFGPTTAKDELHNVLKADKQFNGKKIDVKAADQMTENQMVAEVKGWFGG